MPTSFVAPRASRFAAAPLCLASLVLPAVLAGARVPVGAERAAALPAEVGKPATASPAWAVPFGREFWHGRKGVNLSVGAEAFGRVTHAFSRPTDGSPPFVMAGRYFAALTGDGFHFASVDGDARSARRIGGWAWEGLPSRAAHFRTVSVRRGGHEFFRGEAVYGVWVMGNTRQRLLDPCSGLVEHIETRHEGVEVTWVVPQELPGAGPLTIEVDLDGLECAGRNSSGLLFADTTGAARLRLSPAIAVDKTNRRWSLPIAQSGERFRIDVPAEVLTQASFPLAIDPILSPEFGLDQLLVGPTPCTRATPAVAVNASGFLVAWIHGKSDATDAGVYAARVDPLGNLLDPFGILISSSAAEQSVCKVAALPDGFLVAWSAPHGTSATDWDILAARLRWDGTVLDPTPLTVCTLAGSVQNSPAVAANGDNYLVVWADARGTGIYGTIVNPDGRLSPTNGFPITTAGYEQFTPAVAALGTNYLVAWQDYRNSTASAYASDIYGARVSGAGVLMDPNAIPICRQPNSQLQPAVAANGAHYLVVWEDYDVGGNDILGARVGADGVVLDTNALMVARAPNAQCNPVAAPNFSGFLVAWQDYRDSPGTNFAAATYATRVLDDGSVTYPDGVKVSSSSGEQWTPAVTGFWDDFLVVWEDMRDNPDTTYADIYGAAVESGRGLTAYPGERISVSAVVQLAPKPAACGTNYLVVWADNRNACTNGWDVYCARLALDGTSMDASPIPVCTATNHQREPALALQGTNYLVVWSDLRNTSSNTMAADIYGAFVDLAGTVSPEGGFPICTVTNDQNRPAVTAFGSGYLVVWQDARNSLTTAVRYDIYGTRVSMTGEVLDPGGIAICTNIANQSSPAAVGHATQALVAWTDFRVGSSTDIYGARIDGDGTVLDANGLRICFASLAQSAPALATDGEAYLVAWTDQRSSVTGADIYGAKVGSDGLVSPVNGFAVRIASGLQLAPTVAFNGLDYLVAWQEARSSLSNSFDIFAAGLTPEGALFASGPLFVDTNPYNQSSPAAAAGADGRFLVVNQGSQALTRRAVANLVNLEAIPRLDSAAVLADGQVEFRLRCSPGETYAVEASEDLQLWLPFADFSSTNHSIWISDPHGTNSVRRFYRATLLLP